MPYKKEDRDKIADMIINSTTCFAMGVHDNKVMCFLNGDHDEMIKIIQQACDNAPDLYKVLAIALLDKMERDGKTSIISIPIPQSDKDVN